MFAPELILSLEYKGRGEGGSSEIIGWSSFVLLRAPYLPKCIKVSPIHPWQKYAKTNVLFKKTTKTKQHSPPPNKLSFKLLGEWHWYHVTQRSLSKISSMLVAPFLPTPPFLLTLKPVLPSCYRHHHSDMKGEKQVLHHCQGETLISQHLHSSPTTTGYMNAEPWRSLIGWHRRRRRKKKGILLFKTSGPPAFPHFSSLPPPVTVTLGWRHKGAVYPVSCYLSRWNSTGNRTGQELNDQDVWITNYSHSFFKMIH